jgi:hypothetical protein
MLRTEGATDTEATRIIDALERAGLNRAGMVVSIARRLKNALRKEGSAAVTFGLRAAS